MDEILHSIFLLHQKRPVPSKGLQPDGKVSMTDWGKLLDLAKKSLYGSRLRHKKRSFDEKK